jgi:hypothetical protein
VSTFNPHVGGVIVSNLNQIGDLAKGELRAWLEPWFEPRGTSATVGTGGGGTVGPPGPAGPPGPGAVYEFTQASPSATWTVTHNLGLHPSVTVVDTGGSVVIPDVHYASVNALTISFGSATSGAAYLN